MPAGPVPNTSAWRLQRADIGVLRGGARAHRALAQIDLLERRARGRRVEVEQRALRDGQADRAFDVAGGEIVAALDAARRGLRARGAPARRRRASLERDVVAALLGDDAEPALDQREVLAVLAEQDGGEAVVVEGEHDLRRSPFPRRRRRAGSRRSGVRKSALRLLLRRNGAAARGASASAPNRLLVPTSVMVTGTISPISDAGAMTCTGCRYGERPTSCPGWRPGFSNSTSKRRADASAR